MFISIEPTEDPETVCIYIDGKLNAESHLEFETKFQEAQQRAKIIFIDFSAVNQIDTLGLATLLSCFHQCLNANVRIMLLHLQFSPNSVIELTKTEQVFEILSPKYLSGNS